MKKLLSFGLVVLFMVMEPFMAMSNDNGSPNYPFPQGARSLATYAVQPKMPTNKTQAEMSAMMVGLLKRILEENLIFDTRPEDVAQNPQLNPFTRENFRIVLEHHTTYPVGSFRHVKEQHLNVSESQGYGMLILALMAGSEGQLEAAGYRWRFDAQSLKDYYDGMLRTVLRFPSSIRSSRQFAWELFGHNTTKNETGLSINRDSDHRTRGYRYLENSTASPKVAPLMNTARNQRDYGNNDFYNLNGTSSATDGDMDIIYSLILADKQWGSGGEFDYREIALDMLGGFWRSLINPTTKHLKLGDWANNNITSGYGRGTRASDFIMSHLKAYKAFDPDHAWQDVIDATYDIMATIREGQQALGRPDNGLLPDFIVYNESAAVYKWEPAPANFLEGSNDGNYSYNSCRVPWRLGTDYLLYGDTAFRNKSLRGYILEPLNRMAETAGLTSIGQQKRLDVSRFVGATSVTFAAPFIVSAAAVSDNQAWIDALWNYGHLANWQGNWYADYYKLICMITASGNYWKPEAIR